MQRAVAILLLGTAISACDAVTDPLREGFDADPAPVVGTWTRTLDRPAGPFDVLVERDAGTLSGYFEYALWGRRWIVHFQDATWDGDAITFVDQTDFGQQEADSLVYWSASYAPVRDFPAGSQPALLRLSAAFGSPPRCCVVDMHYYRPGQQPVPSDSLILIPVPGSRVPR